MAASITDPRYAHAEGYTAVAFGRNGDFICTGGSDSLVRVFYSSKDERDQEAITLEQHSDNVLSLAVSRSKIISGDEEGVVFSFGVGTGSSSEAGGLAVEPSGTVLRSALPARDVSISGNERQVAIATDDESITVVSLVDMSQLHTLEGNRTAVNSVSYSPDSVYLVSTGCNGTVRVWDMREDEPSCIKVIHKAAYVCEPGSSMEQYKVRWSPDGRFVAIPCTDHSVKLLERGSWELSATLGGRHTKMVTHVSWSANGRYVASVGLDGQVAVWDVAARKAILTHTGANPLCQVDWNPRGNMLAFTDNSGALYVWDDVVPVEQGHAPPYDQQASERGAVDRQPPADDTGDSRLASDLFDDTAGVDGAAEGEMEVDDGDDDNIVDAGDGLDDFVVDDDGAGYAEQQAPRWAVAGDLQTHAFQPGSTPWVNSRRYLAFNLVGSVTAIAQDASHNTVEIEFFDKSLHRDLHFSDSFKFSMAALSDAGCLFATTSRELANDHSLRTADADDVSVLSYRGFASWSTSADWMFKLPPKEHPRCIAASSHGAAAITSQGMLRLFSCGGVQRHVASLPNRAVTCVARNDLLLVVLEAPGAIKSTAGARRVEYEYILLSLDGQTRVAAGACPVSPAAEIVWAGFSEEGHPASCDSKGMLRVLHRYWSGPHASWVPVLDTRRLSRERGKHENFWPVALSARQFIVVTCRGKSRFPPFPRPILDELDVEIPLLHADSQAGQQEAKYLAARVFCEQQQGEAERTASEYPGGDTAHARDDLEQDKLLLRLIQLACKADKTQRAVDLALMIRLERSFDAALKIAIHQKQTALAERLVRIKENRFATDEYSDDNEDPEIHENGNSGTVAPGRRRHRPPAATYGKPQTAAVSSDSGEDITIDEPQNRPPLPQALLPADTPAADDVEGVPAARPAQPPVTSKPFNPFGVAAPATSMDIKRSDSFFDAADLHTKCLDQNSPALSDSASDLSAAPGKRQMVQPAVAPRKQAKMSAFTFKKQAPPPPPSPPAASTHPGCGDSPSD
ncbi:DNA polymerase alpha accessory factor Mcl1 [Coemansia guatemalensis]|uniref:DNA polymerase alpha accessory factor Mcl1 n=1 Tax=Coemansia guatemalensis TaxID=2761395 RepID=A0A9W8I3G7_9FUNG|nr:DNA polymerase alpha accessory factor Mcl1 [Coemansia guatemalensis]